MTDWKAWLQRYEKPQSPYSQRLRTVCRIISRRLDRLAPDSVTIISICAGDGRDVIETLAGRDDASRITAVLVEIDPRLCELARARIAEAGLGGLEIKEADAGITDTYAGAPRADLVLLVGVFGNISDADVQATLAILPALCQPGAMVVWSLRQQRRHDPTAVEPRRLQAGLPGRNDRDRVERIGRWFERAGFDEVSVNRPDAAFHVGVERFVGRPRSLPPGQRFFAFGVSKNEIAPEA